MDYSNQVREGNMATATKVCAAHGSLESALDGVRDGVRQLYDLDREKTERLGKFDVSLARLEEKTTAGFQRLEQWQEEFESAQAARDERLDRTLRLMQPKRWTPAQKVAMVSAILGPTGIAVFSLFFKGTI
jgi:flagellar motility protein MotE (MotC chaperone)